MQPSPDLNIFLVICILMGATLALAGLFRPFLGMLVFLVIHFVQPGELIPALAPLRIELVYGLLLIGTLVLRKVSILNRVLFSDRILLGVIVLMGAAVLSASFSIEKIGALLTAIGMVKLFIIAILFYLMVDSEKRLLQTLWCMAAIAAWFAGSSLFAYFHGKYYALGSLDRAEGVNSMAGAPNELAGLLLALFPLLIALLRSTRSIFARIVLVTCGALSLAAIALTGARIIIIALICMAIYYIFQSRHKVITLVACVLIAGSIWISLPVPYKERYLTVERYAEGGQLDSSNELRLHIWRAGLQMFLDHPVFGIGAGQFPKAYAENYGNAHHYMNPHSLLIQVGAELGLVGVLAFLFFLLQIGKGIGVVLRKRRNPETEMNYQMAVACWVMFVGVLIMSSVSHTLYRPYWYVLAGLVAANRNIYLATLKAQSENKELPEKSVDKWPRESRGVEPRFGPAARPAKVQRF